MKAYLISIVLLLAPSMAMGAVKPADFAYGIPLSLKEKGAVYRLEVPLEVYQTVTRSNLGDLRVFNKANAVVPFMLRRPKEQTDILELKKHLPIFPLYKKNNRSAKESLAVRIEKNANGTILNIHANGGNTGQDEKIIGYIIDASMHEARIDALDIIWRRPPQNFVTEVAFQQSADLTHWSPLVRRTTLARMNYQGHQIVKERVTLPSLRLRYLRMVWSDEQDGIEVNRILAIERRGEPARDRQWKSLKGELADGADATAETVTAYEYDSGAQLPVDRVRLNFVEKNTLLEVALFSRPHSESQWRFRKKTLFYSLSFDSTNLVQDTVSPGETTDRYWRMEIAKEALGEPQQIPTLALGWLPHDLLFVARGEGPYILAYGCAKLEESASGNGATASLAQIIRDEKQPLLKEAAVLPRTVLGGPDRLLPEPPPLPWRKWLLWGILIAGVGLIAWMALSLSRGMNKQK